MFALPSWLTTLQHIREQRRDVAWKRLAENLRAVSEARAVTTDIADGVARLGEVQRRSGLLGRVDTERLRQVHDDRADQLVQFADAERHERKLGMCLQNSQAAAAAAQTEVETLQRLGNRLLAARQVEKRRQQEHAAFETALSLSNSQSGE